MDNIEKAKEIVFEQYISGLKFCEFYYGCQFRKNYANMIDIKKSQEYESKHNCRNRDHVNCQQYKDLKHNNMKGDIESGRFPFEKHKIEKITGPPVKKVLEWDHDAPHEDIDDWGKPEKKKKKVD